MNTEVKPNAVATWQSIKNKFDQSLHCQLGRMGDIAKIKHFLFMRFLNRFTIKVKKQFKFWLIWETEREHEQGGAKGEEESLHAGLNPRTLISWPKPKPDD